MREILELGRLVLDFVAKVFKDILIIGEIALAIYFLMHTKRGIQAALKTRGDERKENIKFSILTFVFALILSGLVLLFIR